jgi:hypothetical protein
MTVTIVLIILAAICFACDFFHVRLPKGGTPLQYWLPGWIGGGLCFLTIALYLLK